MRPSSVEYWAWALRVRSVPTKVGQTLVQVRFMLLKVHRNLSWFIWGGGGGGERGGYTRQERREDFLLQGHLSVLTLISVSVSPPCYGSSTQNIPVILLKVLVAGYS